MNWTCFNCLKEINVDSKDIKEEILDVKTIHGIPYKVQYHSAKCPFCGEELSNDEISDADLKKAYKKYGILPGGKQLLSAMNIAAQIICMYHDNGYEITNLKLQKVLFYVQMHFLQKFDQPAFSEDIESWRHGPVVENVYEYFRKYITEDIFVDDIKVQEYFFPLKKEFQDAIAEVVQKTLKLDDWEMVRLSQQKVWSDVYVKNLNILIKKDNIKKYGVMNI